MSILTSLPVQTEAGEQAVGAVPSLGAFEVADTRSVVVVNRAINDDYCHLVLEADGPALSARAGQFFNLACPNTAADMPYLRRPMSVYRVSPAQRRVEFLYKVAGAGTRGLATLQPGDTLAILGPLGNGFTLDPRWKNIVVAGRGVGLATLAPLAEAAAEAGIGVTAILSARAKSLVMSAERFERIGARIAVVTDEDGTSDFANVERHLVTYVEAGQADAFFTCGSNRLMLLMKRLAARFNIAGQVALEQQMACGLGMCFCCVRNFETTGGPEQRRVCVEGPVFDLAEALTW
ncbi:MAG: dihydroorotate dehydrogenase electron transfer subunit [Rhodopseudomonas sp.]|nr:dihydroorotate dehydrogenase electron transfer subunit [Rhodopseudomonas sp.]